uniref:Retrotransposon gag domain-containing protein n=1 Tax=Nicotiana tabacum TaxID=4097 RepID=A0A1S3YZS8_TOBAC|nr:PREDICTED: uncharacterized protein LOC107781419 [Nicotiana tabacum]
MKGNGLTKEQVSSILLKKFGETLTGGALTWYSQLLAYSIETFEEITNKLVTAHVGAKKAETRDEIHSAYCAEIREDDDDLNGPTRRLTSVQSEPRKERMDNIRRDHPISRPGRERHQLYVREPVPSFRYENGPSRPRSSTHMNDREVVYALEKPRTNVKWPPTMRSDSSTKKSDALCEFHQERGHKTEDCHALRLEVANLLQQGHLKELLSDKGRNTLARGRERLGPPKLHSPARTINMIIAGSDDASINGIKFTTTHKLKRSIIHERYDGLKESIIFNESDADDLTFPHNDALVITLRILDTDVRRIVVDDGSGAFRWTSGEITIPVLVSGVNLEKTLHIMDQNTTYKTIVGQRGEQLTSRECYRIAIDGTTT